MNYYALAAGWILYFVLHSALAAGPVKRRAAMFLGKGYRYYRLFYSVVATAGLVALLLLNGNINAEHYFETAGMVRYLSLMFTTFGVMLIQVAFKQYRLKSFLGLVPEEKRLRVDGILRWIRHPIYSGLTLITLGFFLFIPNLPTLITCLIIFLYLPVGIYLEERKMIAEFGQAYTDYRKEVPALIPRFSRLH